MRRAAVVSLLVLSSLPAVAAAPHVEAGGLTLSVIATARRIELDSDAEPKPRVVVTVRLSAAQPGVVERVLDVARGVSLAPTEGLDLLLVRVSPRSTDAEAAEYDLVFDGAPVAGATVRLRGAVVTYAKRRDFQVEISDLAQPVGATGTVGEVSLRVTWLSPSRVGEERRWYFSGRVERSAPEDAGVVQWSGDRLDLLDSEGTRWPALGLRVTHGSEGDKDVVNLDGFFPIPEKARPGVLRYQCTRYEGVTASPYEFTALPLP